MSIYKPSELMALLKEWGISAKRGLSQNFLIDQNIIEKTLDLADVQPGDFCIEIGPGPGALTQALLKRGAHVTAIEMDSVFAKALERLQTEEERLQVICADFLKFPLETFLSSTPGRVYKVIANLPYHITTPILARLFPLYPSISTLTVMVQKEFADRMVASPGTKEYSSFTIFLNFYSTVINRFTVRPTSFYPRPKIHSSVVCCALHPPRLTQGIERFFVLTRTSFQQRRKMLKGSLRELFPSSKVEEGLKTVGKSPQARPEELSLEEWLLLFAFLDDGNTKK